MTDVARSDTRTFALAPAVVDRRARARRHAAAPPYRNPAPSRPIVTSAAGSRAPHVAVEWRPPATSV